MCHITGRRAVDDLGSENLCEDPLSLCEDCLRRGGGEEGGVKGGRRSQVARDQLSPPGAPTPSLESLSAGLSSSATRTSRRLRKCTFRHPDGELEWVNGIRTFPNTQHAEFIASPEVPKKRSQGYRLTFLHVSSLNKLKTPNAGERCNVLLS